MSETNVTKLTPEKIGFYLEFHGHIPWTATIADCIDSGVEWDYKSISTHLWSAQEKIDELTQKLKAKREWVGLTDDEIETLSYAAEGNTWQAVKLAEAKLKEKNHE
jgi:hypothetical protein